MPLEKVHVKYPTKIQKWLRTDWFSDLFEHSPVCFKSMNPSFVAEGSHLDALTLPLVDILNFKMLKALKGCKDLIRSYTIDDWILTYSHIPISYSYHFFLFLSTPSIRQPARRCLRRALAGSSPGRPGRPGPGWGGWPSVTSNDSARCTQSYPASKDKQGRFEGISMQKQSKLPQMHGSLLIIQHSMLGVTQS